MKKKIMIIDYGCGNIESVKRAFEKINKECLISSELNELTSATHLILPGVGAFKNAMQKLKEKKFYNLILDHYKKNKPLLGICLGMQLLFTKSYEFGESDGLNIIDGDVVKLENDQSNEFKVPNIGWYNLIKNENINKNNEQNILHSGEYYHVHSFFCRPKEKENITHNILFNEKKICVAYRKKNVLGVQFHPEKSRKFGLEFLSFFENLDY